MTRLCFSLFFLAALVLFANGANIKIINANTTSLRAGVAKLNATLPIGTPLAGYNHGPRRVPFFPLPIPRPYSTFMEGNVGSLDTNWAKALVIDNAAQRFCFVTMDAIGADGNVVDKAFLKAKARGFTIPRSNVIFSGSHSHSGPGALSPELLWALAPATDLLVPTLQDMYTDTLADAMIQAEQNLTPAKMDIGMDELIGVTRNRRAPNPWVQVGTIDPHLGVIRIDKADGSPLATVWNFAIHGTCYGGDNMKFSGDIMGAACREIESILGGVALFINGDAGDVAPTGETCGCTKGKCEFPGRTKIAEAVAKVSKQLKPSGDVVIHTASDIVPFGSTNLNLTLERLGNCTEGGPLNICTICKILDCGIDIHLGEAWIETNPRFSAVRFDINGKSTGMVTIPGEAIVELGWMVRNDTKDMGFDQTFLLGYSNNHMGYFTTPNEYVWGGYESLLTLWGIGTADKIRNGCKQVAEQVKP